MDSHKPPATPGALIRAELPRILVWLGAGFVVLGAIATIAFVASDSSCNSATNLSSGVGVAQAGFCGHVQGFETGGFVILAAGAVLLALGSLILPVLRDRDARRAADAPPAEPADQDAPSQP